MAKLTIKVLKSVHIGGKAYFKGDTYQVDSEIAKSISKEMGADAYVKAELEDVEVEEEVTVKADKKSSKKESKVEKEDTGFLGDEEDSE